MNSKFIQLAVNQKTKTPYVENPYDATALFYGIIYHYLPLEKKLQNGNLIL